MFERTQSFDMNDQNYRQIQQKVEDILKNNLNYSVSTEKFGASLLRINYFDEITEKKAQRSNKITLLKEPGKKIYIQISGQLTDIQTGSLWKELEKDLQNLSNVETQELTKPTKEEIIEELMEIIKLKGYTIDKDDAEGFLEKFQGKYKRLPKNEEIGAISKSYIIMVNEDYLTEKANALYKTEPLSESVNLHTDEIDNPIASDSANTANDIIEPSIGRRRCPSCGDEGSIREVIDKTVLILDYPRIYGKKNHCCRCAYEWRK
ncbi:MAG: hypothetical protein ACW986_15065 [Promethearchaeota archaeon]|jgi:hypothetical protein